MRGGKNRQPLGYTIVEVMIVLAVSGVMFVIAASFINGKQARTAFTTGVNDMASTIQDTLDQVSDGKYSDIPLNCSFNGTQTSITSGGSNQQGTNATCVFLGKMIRWDVGAADYTVYSLAGGRSTDFATGTTDITNLNAADPRVISDLNTTGSVPQQLTVKKITIDSSTFTTSPPHDDPVFGFLQSLGTASGGALKTGGQSIGLYYMDLTRNFPIQSSTPLSIMPANTIDVCLTDDTRTAHITIGSGNDSQQAVNVRMTGNTPC
jgi:prepilin-type N-terminal cleavage/methylation domain-containing protein